MFSERKKYTNIRQACVNKTNWLLTDAQSMWLNRYIFLIFNGTLGPVEPHINELPPSLWTRWTSSYKLANSAQTINYPESWCWSLGERGGSQLESTIDDLKRFFIRFIYFKERDDWNWKKNSYHLDIVQEVGKLAFFCWYYFIFFCLLYYKGQNFQSAKKYLYMPLKWYSTTQVMLATMAKLCKFIQLFTSFSFMQQP